LGQEVEELRGAQDGVGDRPGLDPGLLGDLGAQVAAVGQSVGSDDRQRDVVADARLALGCQLVARRGGEELQHGVVVPDRGVLVHGAFAESASWDRVIDPLMEHGHAVVAAANPLRGLATDAAAVSDLVRTLDGPVVLVAHSYGGAVMSNVDPDAGDIVGLVYA